MSRRIRAGKLDRTIIIQSRTANVDDAGRMVDVWQDVLTTRAEVIELSTSAFLRDPGDVNETGLIFYARHSPDVTPGMRVMFHGVAFDIKIVVEIGRRHGMELRCTATLS